MARLARCLGVTVLIGFLAITPAWAQATAQLSGTVTDESGAVLPGDGRCATTGTEERERLEPRLCLDR